MNSTIVLSRFGFRIKESRRAVEMAAPVSMPQKQTGRRSSLQMFVGWMSISLPVLAVLGTLYGDIPIAWGLGYGFLAHWPGFFMATLPFAAIVVALALTGWQLARKGRWVAMLLLGMAWLKLMHVAPGYFAPPFAANYCVAAFAMLAVSTWIYKK